MHCPSNSFAELKVHFWRSSLAIFGAFTGEAALATHKMSA
jgi:hypothetical protein